MISELATEREALANNSARVSESLKGVGAQIARDISNASNSIDKKLAERGIQLTELLVARSSEAAEQVHKAQARVTEARWPARTLEQGARAPHPGDRGRDPEFWRRSKPWWRSAPPPWTTP